ncbi:MAG: NAD(P)-dependent oxidoreductase [Anaerolineales bacterium]|jgi:dTDP-4-dehydrorhamnose reductase|nr:NAD(P)-dependent oxidoreductase [Anaerolineales bacterium]
MKILISGASGLLGLNLCLMNWDSHILLGLDRGKLDGTPFALIHATLDDPAAASRLIDTLKPDAVIHTAALANLEKCEADPQAARYLNGEIPGILAESAARASVRFIHISTDAVFDGTKDGIYTEADAPSPLGVYSATKLLGEQNVLSANPAAIVARVNFFGWSLSGTRSLAEFFYNKLSAGQPCNGFTDVYFCPLFVGDLAAILVRMLEKDLAGLYHVVGSESLSKFDFGVRIARQFRFDEKLVQPQSVEKSGLTAKRSHNLRLSVHKLSTDLGLPIPGVSTGIEQFYTQFQQGYPQKMRTYQQIGDL